MLKNQETSLMQALEKDLIRERTTKRRR